MISSKHESNRIKILEHIRKNAIHFEGCLLSGKGRQLDWLIDLRPTVLDPEMVGFIAEEFWRQNPVLDQCHIAGLESASIPIVTAITMEGQRLGKTTSGIIVRKDRKKTGLGKLVEGSIRFGGAVIVDDVFNSGATLEKVRVRLAQCDILATRSFSIIDYKSRKGARFLKEKRIDHKSIFCLSDFGISLKNKSEKNLPYRLKHLWKYTAVGGNPFFSVPKSAPIINGGKLTFGTDSGEMHCISLVDGKLVWKFKAPECGRKGIWSSPALVGENIVFGAYNGTLYSLNAQTGETVWESHLCDWIGSSPVADPAGTLVFIGLEYSSPTVQGSICAFKAASGQKVWEKLLRKYQHGSGAYSAKHQLVIFGTNDHTVIAMRPTNGKIVWEFKTKRSVKYAPTIDEELSIVCFTSFDGGIYALDLKTGEQKFRTQTGNICYTTPLIHQGKVFAGSADKHFYVLDALDGKILERHRMSGRIFSNPIAYRNSVIFGTSSGQIVSVNTSDYQKHVLAQVPDSISNKILVNGDMIYVPTVMNEIYCYSVESN